MQDVFGIKPHSFKKSGVLGFTIPLTCKWVGMMCCFLYSNLVFAQREAFNYIQGKGVYLDWNEYPDYWKTGAKTEDKDGYRFPYASISDKYGKLLFYFDGVNIYNWKHEQMKGKQTGLQYSDFQNPTVAPFIIPLAECKYYIVHDGMYPKSNPNQYGPFHLVDMAANDGEGEVKEVFYAPPNSDMMEPNFYFDFTNATLHANGKDIWLLMGAYEYIYSYLIEYNTGTVRKRNSFYQKDALFDNRNVSGHDVWFSPKGDYFHTVVRNVFTGSDKYVSQLFGFDNSTGLITSIFKDTKWNKLSINLDGKYWYDSRDINTGIPYPRQFCRYAFSTDFSSLNKPIYCWGKQIYSENNVDGVDLHVQSPNGIVLVTEGKREQVPNPIERTFPFTVYWTEILNPDSDSPIIKRKVRSQYVSNKGDDLWGNNTRTPRFISNFFDPAWVNRPLPSTKAKWEKGARQCVGQAISFKIKEDLPGESIRINWGDGSDTIVNTLAQELKHVYTKSGKYQLQIERKEACTTDGFKDTVEILPMPVIKSNPDTSFLCGSQSVVAKVQNPVPDFVYSWNNGNKGAETELKEIGSYTVSASNRCGIAYDTVVVKEGSWQIPNVFTPNGDGVNDSWNITSKTTEQAHVKVLNRWGNVVYESEKYGNDWEANNVPDGVYFYQITQNEGCQYKGWVQILR